MLRIKIVCIKNKNKLECKSNENNIKTHIMYKQMLLTYMKLIRPVVSNLVRILKSKLKLICTSICRQLYLFQFGQTQCYSPRITPNNHATLTVQKDLLSTAKYININIYKTIYKTN